MQPSAGVLPLVVAVPRERGPQVLGRPPAVGVTKSRQDARALPLMPSVWISSPRSSPSATASRSSTRSLAEAEDAALRIELQQLRQIRGPSARMPRCLSQFDSRSDQNDSSIDVS